MVDVAVSAQLQQWTFEKPTTTTTTTLVRPDRSGSSASSPDLYNNDPETLRIDAAAVDEPQRLDSNESLSLQERYLSSEEDLSPMEMDSESDFEDDVSIHDFQEQCLSARKMSISKVEAGKSCDLAVMVSYVSAGRPKMIDLATGGSPIRETTQRSASLAQLPIAAISKLRKADGASRHSFVAATRSATTSRSSSPVCEVRRPSTGHIPFSHNNSSLRIADSSSSFTDGSVRSSSPPASEDSTRPASAATSHPPPRSSLYISSTVNTTNNQSTSSSRIPFPPLTPLSPEPHSFLSSDPYENSTTSAASPIIKSGAHKRLRSISQRLSLAKIAITPSTKKWDSRVNGRPGMPPTPATPYTPMTPMTAPPTTTSNSVSSPKNRLRRNSRASRPSSMRGPSPETPPVPILHPAPQPRRPAQKLVPRGAGEREPILELPPCPDESETVEPVAEVKVKRVRKRKSLMDLL
ncbi:hypothetical protein CC78DRAFT_388931 [Lojkania enalia]|uniref:Uncharacterized protein n=1 Tax=Lojkania enalia TaxID=147567 RepID=A0A9P4K1W5_9PLEO|nr:hypothetical protein CC78DRAFT_388931 [Didymosphaeria enalia]